MAEPHSILPYDDPFDHNLNSVEHLLMPDDYNYSSLLNFYELPSPLQQNDFSFNPSPGADVEIIPPGNHPPVDPFLVDNEMFEEDDTANRSSDFGNPIQLSSWPLQVPPYTCSCCQVLREITHSNGVEITKLEVHGRLGVISHAVLEKYGVDLATNQTHDYKMFDFCKESISRVKLFLVEYCKERKANGYMMMQDPLSGFYEAVCVGLDWEYSMDTDDLILDDSGDHQMNQPDVEGNRGRLSNKTPLSMQRERAGKLTIKDLIGYFHIPIEVAGKEIQVCPTVIKKICRKHGLSRWPYRKIKSIERKISMKEKCLNSVDAEERRRARSEIDKLRQEIASIYARFNVN